jgi:hypothetical protein
MKPGTLFASTLILALVAVAATGCGRKADPVPPSVAASQEGKPVPPPVKDRKFVLDGLLD